MPPPHPSRRSKRIRNVAFELCECRLLFTTYPLTSVPALYSRPSAPATIYLDFTGAPASTWNGISVPTTPAFDIDGDPTTFSSQELTDIQQIWAIVAEAYSPFNVDVTTVDPEPVTHNYLVNQSMRIVIGGSNTWSGTNDGGVSVDGSFSESFLARTSYVFSNEFAGNVFELGEIASHEAGHEFGLDIQSAYSGTTQTAYFNPGNSLEAPIMGVSYYSQRGVWWDGPTEASSTTIQDDMAVISSSTNGFGYAPLTVGQTIATATPLTISAGSATASGVIEQTTQTDYYSFATTGGSVTLNVNVAPYGAMLHAEEQIVNSSGTVIATADNANTLGQTITANLTAGTYHLVVGSYGQYGDVGQYTVTGTVPQTAAASFSISGASSVNERSLYTLSLSATDPGQTISSWVINWGDGNNQTVTGDPSSVNHTYALGPNSYNISATATDGTGTYSASNTVNVIVAHVPPTLTLSGTSSINEDSTYTLGLAASDPGHTISSWLINWGDGNTQTVTGNPSSVIHTYGAGPQTDTITATATDDVSTYSASNSISLSIIHVPPTPTLSGAATVNERSLYTLDMSAIELAGHAVVAWSINWGDGTIQAVTGNPSSVTHTYAVGPNNYTISATATDDVGTYSAGNTVSVGVAHVPPTLTISGATSINERSVYTLNLGASDPGHIISSWSINWGDGTIQALTGNPSSVTHTYAVGPNNYTISATATDDVGTYSAGNTVSVGVAHVPPNLTISGAAAVYEQSTYALSLASSDPGHTISAWSINWGDGTVQALAGNPSSVTHTYAVGPNNYTISATATDDVGTYSADNSVTVNVAHVAPTLSISGTASINEGSTYTLVLSATDPGHTVSAWSINWGDGTVQALAGNPSSVTHTYAVGPNNYTISATATDDVGTYSAGNSVTVNVAHVAPTLSISGTTSINEGSTYTLALSATDPGHTVSAWSINWGDGDIQSVIGSPSSVTHVFTTGSRNYTISATATDNVSTYSAAPTLTVNVANPTTTSLAITPADAAAGQTVTLAATVTAGYGIPTGTVTFTYGTTILGSAALGSSGKATITESTWPAGTYDITATYSSSDSNRSSTTSAPFTIGAPGWVDSADMNDISGWAFDPSNPTASINIEVAISGGPTQTFAANQSRSDLQAVLGSTNHGFTYSTPVLSVGSHTASIYAVETNGTKVLLATKTLVSQNSLFDEHYYLKIYPNVAVAVANGEFATGYDHYIEYGQYEGYSPSPYWDEAWYLKENPDVAAAVKAGTVSSGFMQYYLYGQYENRGGLLYFNTSYYLKNNPDVAAAIIAGTITSAFEHFVLYGQYEGRNPMLYFSSAVYDADYPGILSSDTGETFSSNFQQFVEVGQYQSLIASNYYNEQIYLADNPDVAAAVKAGEFQDGFQQWLMYGQYEGRTAV